MRVEKFTLDDFRGFRGTTRIEPHGMVSVICGSNGAGKTSLLDALANLICRIPARIAGTEAPAFVIRRLTGADVSLGADRTATAISISDGALHAKIYNHFGARSSPDVTSTEHARPKPRLLDQLRDGKDDDGVVLPFVGYIHSGSTRRLANGDDLERINHPRLRGYAGCFDTDLPRFVHLEKWYEQEENLENQEKIRSSNLTLSLRSLRAVRSAVTALLTSLQADRIQNLHVVRAHGRDPLKPARARLAITKNDDELFIDQLSDGERRLVLIAADTARRMVILNPGMAEPLQTPGILLIDEIELHLHPKWQRRVIPALRAAFPKLQLIVTTHSPQVLSSVPNEAVIMLSEGRVVPGLPAVSGRDTNTILEDVMDTPARPPEVQSKLDELASLIETDSTAARARLVELEAELTPDDVDLVRARAMLEFVGA
jgi:predicted ATP-binding protein involved in virulence